VLRKCKPANIAVASLILGFGRVLLLAACGTWDVFSRALVFHVSSGLWELWSSELLAIRHLESHWEILYYCFDLTAPYRSNIFKYIFCSVLVGHMF
jgi:hypothetical protein